MIKRPEHFFAMLGDLHDARLRCIASDAAGATLSLGVADLDCSQLGLPGYRGPRPAQLDFSDVRFVEGELTPGGAVTSVFDLDVSRENAGYRATLRLAPAGRIVWTFGTVSVA